jgi:hypothetical protein
MVLINAFEVPADADDAFLAIWEASRQFLRKQPGYLATRLHRSLSPETDFRFVNVGRYAVPGVPGGYRPVWVPEGGRGHPAPRPFGLYEVVRR